MDMLYILQRQQECNENRIKYKGNRYQNAYKLIEEPRSRTISTPARLSTVKLVPSSTKVVVPSSTKVVTNGVSSFPPRVQHVSIALLTNANGNKEGASPHTQNSHTTNPRRYTKKVKNSRRHPVGMLHVEPARFPRSPARGER